jgi:hypothetical protein
MLPDDEGSFVRCPVVAKLQQAVLLLVCVVVGYAQCAARLNELGH